ncbi:capsular biosynthesis protein, partial [Campylobacter jejuni]|nr:capsular biosynthesis protein [Campylobacter jejuni]
HEKYDYKIVFSPHPQIRPYLEGFNLPNYIIIPSVEMSMQKLFCESSLMITDYSSVAFEMAVLKKPVIYYQFDKDELFAKHTYTQGYFDYNKDGFGIVVLDIDNLLYELKMKLQNHSFKNNFLTPKANSLEKVTQAILFI